MHRGLYLVVSSVVFSAVSVFGGPNLLNNPSFENFSVTSTSYTGIGNGGSSAATDWMVWNNTNVTTNTLICPGDPNCPAGSPSPADGAHMLYVDTPGAFNGIWQQWAPTNTGSDNATTVAFVYVVSGAVQVGTGNDGSTVKELVLVPTGTWQQVTWFNSQLFNKPANEIIFYSDGAGAQFFVDGVQVVDGLPEPATFALTGGALVALGLIARKRRARK